MRFLQELELLHAGSHYCRHRKLMELEKTQRPHTMGGLSKRVVIVVPYRTRMTIGWIWAALVLSYSVPLHAKFGSLHFRIVNDVGLGTKSCQWTYGSKSFCTGSILCSSELGATVPLRSALMRAVLGEKSDPNAPITRLMKAWFLGPG